MSKSSSPASPIKTTMASYGGLRNVDMCSRAQMSRASRSRRLHAHEPDLDNHRPGNLLLCYDQRTIPRTSMFWSLRHGDILRDVKIPSPRPLFNVAVSARRAGHRHRNLRRFPASDADPLSRRPPFHLCRSTASGSAADGRAADSRALVCRSDRSCLLLPL